MQWGRLICAAVVVPMLGACDNGIGCLAGKDWESSGSYNAERVPLFVESKAAPLLASVAVSNDGPDEAMVYYREVWGGEEQVGWSQMIVSPGHTAAVSGYAIHVAANAPEYDGSGTWPDGRKFEEKQLEDVSACGTVEHLGVREVSYRPPVPTTTAPEEGIEKPGTPQ